MTEYSKCWELYKKHTETFHADFDYYFELCKNKTTLELFAGYGRLANYLHEKNIDIETVEIQPEFAQFIAMPQEHVHVCDVLDFHSSKKYQRIIAAYNSFCLITKNTDIYKMFSIIDSLLCENGIVSLSYYDHNFWEGDYEEVFTLDGNQVIYNPTCDLSARNVKIGKWIDRYQINSQSFDFPFVTRIYEDINDLLPFIEHTNLELIEVIKDYHKQDIFPGWLEFVLKKVDKCKIN